MRISFDPAIPPLPSKLLDAAAATAPLTVLRPAPNFHREGCQARELQGHTGSYRLAVGLIPVWHRLYTKDLSSAYPADGAVRIDVNGLTFVADGRA